jgi:hypothetical protein
MGLFVQKVWIKVFAHTLLHSLFHLLVTGKIYNDVQLDLLEEIAIHRMGSSGLSPTIHDLMHNNPLHKYLQHNNQWES